MYTVEIQNCLMDTERVPTRCEYMMEHIIDEIDYWKNRREYNCNDSHGPPNLTVVLYTLFNRWYCCVLTVVQWHLPCDPHVESVYSYITNKS